MNATTLPAAVIYDWDNTLIDTFPLLYEVTNLTRAQFGKPPFTEDEARRNIRRSARDVLPEIYGDVWQDAYAFFIENIRARHLERLLFMAGAGEMVLFLNKLGVRQGVFSNKTNTILRAEVEKFPAGFTFSAAVGSGDFEGLGKPDAAGLVYTASRMGLDKSLFSNVWYVGDTENDIKTAHNAGMVPVFIENDPMSDADEIALLRPKYRFKNCIECLAHLTTLG